MSKITLKSGFKEDDGLGRVDWDKYFLVMTYVVASRSFDTSTKCGCIATRENVILSTGYNGPPSGSLDYEVPIDVRPDKYWYMEHAERNTIYNAARNGVSLKDCTFYVTGEPCIDCMRGMLTIKPKAIIYPSSNNTHMKAYKETVGDVERWLSITAQHTEIIEYRGLNTGMNLIDFSKLIHTNIKASLGI